MLGRQWNMLAEGFGCASPSARTRANLASWVRASRDSLLNFRHTPLVTMMMDRGASE